MVEITEQSGDGRQEAFLLDLLDRLQRGEVSPALVELLRVAIRRGEEVRPQLLVITDAGDGNDGRGENVAVGDGVTDTKAEMTGVFVGSDVGTQRGIVGGAANISKREEQPQSTSLPSRRIEREVHIPTSRNPFLQAKLNALSAEEMRDVERYSDALSRDTVWMYLQRSKPLGSVHHPKTDGVSLVVIESAEPPEKFAHALRQGLPEPLWTAMQPRAESNTAALIRVVSDPLKAGRTIVSGWLKNPAGTSMCAAEGGASWHEFTMSVHGHDGERPAVVPHILEGQQTHLFPLMYWCALQELPCDNSFLIDAPLNGDAQTGFLVADFDTRTIVVHSQIAQPPYDPPTVLQCESDADFLLQLQQRGVAFTPADPQSLSRIVGPHAVPLSWTRDKEKDQAGRKFVPAREVPRKTTVAVQSRAKPAIAGTTPQKSVGTVGASGGKPAAGQTPKKPPATKGAVKKKWWQFW